MVTVRVRARVRVRLRVMDRVRVRVGMIKTRLKVRGSTIDRHNDGSWLKRGWHTRVDRGHLQV